MLRAALIGFSSSGKTTLFQLMTSARDAPRGRSDVNIGISKVPDARLDTLTAMYNPKKRVPATVEFTDMAAPAKSGAQALVDVAGYKNADALVHVVRAFRDPAVAHPSGSVDPARDAQAMEDELILADLGVAERRLERIEKDLKKGRSAELEKERDLVQRCKQALEEGKPLRTLQLTGDDIKRLRGFQFLSAKPLLLVINLDEADVPDVGASVERAAAKTGLTSFLAHAATRRRRALRHDRARDLAARRRRRRGVPRRSRTGGIRPRPRDSRELRPARLHVVLHCRRGRVPRLVDCARNPGAGWPPAKFTATSSAASSARKSSAYDALISRGSMAACRDHGEVRLEGKEYVVQDGDIINFRFAT